MDVIAPLRHGVAPHLEAEADRLIKESLKGTTRFSDKDDILTPWKERMRHEREVFNSTGVADPAVRRGMYHRVKNTQHPHLNSTEGVVRGGAIDSLSEFVDGQKQPSPMDEFWR